MNKKKMWNISQLIWNSVLFVLWFVFLELVVVCGLTFVKGPDAEIREEKLKAIEQKTEMDLTWDKKKWQ